MTNLVVHDLNKRFGGLHVLKDDNFEIDGPELLGPAITSRTPSPLKSAARAV